jgi:asparagine synthetase B (glutamine-hydrolysing)
MEFDDLMIVYNGEVYNYLELRDELTKKGYRFRANSDTEVVLAAYKEWGSDCVKRLVGMWAFAIWDKTRRELFCSRDRFGIKPFYYIHAGDKFYLGSEYKPLKFSPLFDSKFNYRQISRGLFLPMASYQDETYFECLKILPARTNLIFKNGRISLSDPMAQDFFATFGHDGAGQIGSETTINSGDMAGILMIAVQALEKRTVELKQKEEQIAVLQSDISDL